MKIKVRISTEDAVLVGLPDAGIVAIEADTASYTLAQRELLAGAIRAGREDVANVPFSVVVRGSYVDGPRLAALTSEALQDAIQGTLDAGVAAEAKAKADHESEVARLLALTPEEACSWYISERIARDPRMADLLASINTAKRLRDALAGVSRVRDAIARSGSLWGNDLKNLRTIATDLADDHPLRQALNDYDAMTVALDRERDAQRARNAEIAAAKEAQRDAQRARNAEIAAAKEAQLAAWVAAHGTANQQARHAAGMLPEDEVLVGIRDQAFAGVSRPQYERLTALDVGCTCEYDVCELSFATTTLSEVDASQWETMETVRLALVAEHPDVSVSLRQHTGTRSECQEVTTRDSVLAVLTVGAFTLRRDFQV